MTANDFKPFCSNQELDEIHLIKPCVAEQLTRTRGRWPAEQGHEDH